MSLKYLKSTTGQGEDYTIGCLLDYEYIKNHYRLIAIDLKNSDPKAMQQIEFVKQLKKLDPNYNLQMQVTINLCLF